MDDFVFSSGFNLANMTCPLVELSSFNPISTSWNVKFAKLKPLSPGLGCLEQSGVRSSKKSPGQETGLGNRGRLKVLNDTKFILNDD